MIGFRYIILLAIVAYNCKAALLPTYINICCFDDSISDCIMGNINRALKAIALGDDHYNVPSYFPLHLPKVTVLKSNQGNFTVTNLRVYGFPDANLTSVNFDLAAGTYSAQYTIEKLTVDCDYDILLENTNVAGFGKAQITMRNVTVDQSFLIQLDDEGYVRVRNPTANYRIQSTYYNMGNMDASSNAYMNMNAVALDMLFESQVNEAFSDVLTLPYIALFDLIKLTDVIDFNCPTNTTTTTPSTTTCPTSTTFNILTILG